LREKGDVLPEKLFTFRSAGWTIVLSLALIALILWQVFAHLSKHERIGDGETLSSYRFDLTTTLVPKEDLQPARYRGFLPALDDPGSMTVEDLTENPKRWLRKLLVPSDRVIGVRIGDQVRAYPLRVLNWHEIANDVLGGRPIAVTFHPLTDSAAVFDRRVGGETLLFRLSGILYQSGQLFYEERPEIGTESLFCQLQARAIAGPLAAKGVALERIPFELTEWGIWLGRYPETTVVAPDPTFHKHYSRRPYASYFGTRQPRYEVDGYPPEGEPDAWSRVVVPAGAEPLEAIPLADLPVPPPEIVAHALRWAWAATHP
jgi:hypothetical protein